MLLTETRILSGHNQSIDKPVGWAKMVNGPAIAVDVPEMDRKKTLPEEMLGTFHVPIPEFEALETEILFQVDIESELYDHWIVLPAWVFHLIVVFPGVS